MINKGNFNPKDLRSISPVIKCNLFKIGDIVTLRSGGPPMLVVDHDKDKTITSWREDDVIIEKEFLTVCLEFIQEV